MIPTVHIADVSGITMEESRSQKLEAAGFHRRPSLWALEAREALELIATPRRPDGTWNRDREACRQLAAEVLGLDEAEPKQPEDVQPWRPIETAPLDGTRVLCVWPHARGGPTVYEGWCQGVGNARDGGDVWRSHSLVPVSGRPTHWMPLPPPPGAEPAAVQPVALKPLTDEQIINLSRWWHHADGASFADLVRKIELAIGIGAEPAKGE